MKRIKLPPIKKSQLNTLKEGGVKNNHTILILLFIILSSLTILYLLN